MSLVPHFRKYPFRTVPRVIILYMANVLVTAEQILNLLKLEKKSRSDRSSWLANFIDSYEHNIICCIPAKHKRVISKWANLNIV